MSIRDYTRWSPWKQRLPVAAASLKRPRARFVCLASSRLLGVWGGVALWMTRRNSSIRALCDTPGVPSIVENIDSGTGRTFRVSSIEDSKPLRAPEPRANIRHHPHPCRPQQLRQCRLRCRGRRLGAPPHGMKSTAIFCWQCKLPAHW